MTPPKFQVGDLVMFKGRTQKTTAGMFVQEVDSNMFDTRYKVDYLWWMESNLQSLQDWKGSLK